MDFRLVYLRKCQIMTLTQIRELEEEFVAFLKLYLLYSQCTFVSLHSSCFCCQYILVSECLTLKEGPISFRSNRPVVGILHKASSGYQLVEIDVHLRTIQIHDYLTQDSLVSKLLIAGTYWERCFHA